jgi:hypothetical protein
LRKSLEISSLSDLTEAISETRPPAHLLLIAGGLLVVKPGRKVSRFRRLKSYSPLARVRLKSGRLGGCCDGS